MNKVIYKPKNAFILKNVFLHYLYGNERIISNSIKITKKVLKSKTTKKVIRCFSNSLPLYACMVV